MTATADTPTGHVTIQGRTASELEAAADAVQAHAYRYPIDGGHVVRMLRIPGTGWVALS